MKSNVKKIQASFITMYVYFNFTKSVVTSLKLFLIFSKFQTNWSSWNILFLLNCFIKGFYFAAVLTFTSMIWFTIELHNEFFANLDNYIQWEIGACIYLGYVSSLFSLLAFLACVCAPGPRQESNFNSFSYKPAAVGGAEETKNSFAAKKNRHSHRFTDYVW